MPWSIAQAKHQLSEVVRLAAEEPQAIYKRNTPVAVVVGNAEYEAFRHWKARQSGNPLSDSLSRLRAELDQAGFDGVEIEPRPPAGRPNSFEQMLDQEYPAAPARKGRRPGRTRAAR